MPLYHFPTNLKTAVTELAKYKLDLVAAQEVRWDKRGSQSADYKFFYGNGIANHHLGTDFCTQWNHISR
jgi:hypothetical protein